MKKKVFLLTVCLLCVSLCLIGCASHAEQFKKIDKLFNANYSAMHLTVTVYDGTDEYESNFDVTFVDENTSAVSFEIKRLATFPSDGSLPDNFIETFSGSATVKNGQVVQVSGDVPADVQLSAVVGRGLKFSESYFSDVKIGQNSLSAKVTQPQAFLSRSGFSCKAGSMAVSVGYYSLLDYVRIQYLAESGAKVVLMYKFEA